MKKNLHNGLKPIPESKMSPEAALNRKLTVAPREKNASNFASADCR
jgi:hypothetical protein